MLLKKSLIVAALLAASVIGTTATAGTTTGQFTVQLTVNATCAVNTTGASNITLAGVNAGSTTTAVPGTFSVNCSNKTPFSVGLLPGNGNTSGAGVLSGTTAGNTGTTIAYQLNQTTSGGPVWGNTVGTNTLAGTGGGMASAKAVSFTAYANATGSTDVVPDTYKDTVTINVNF